VSAAAPPWGWRKAIASAESKNTFVPERALQNLLLQHNRPKPDSCTAAKCIYSIALSARAKWH
ncbi:MAG: hypothetical protein ABSB77_15830, partial [Xanthobacteraceae bacterium]